MNHYLAHATPQNIGYCLIIAVVLWGAYQIATAPRNLRTPPKRYPVNPSSAANLILDMDTVTPQKLRQTVEFLNENLDREMPINELLDGIESLRTQLKDHKNPTQPGSGVKP